MIFSRMPPILQARAVPIGAFLQRHKHQRCRWTKSDLSGRNGKEARRGGGTALVVHNRFPSCQALATGVAAVCGQSVLLSVSTDGST